MSEEKKNWLGPYIPQGSIISEVIQQFKLAFNLMIDPRVHPLTKLIPIAALTYLVLPLDLVPDVAIGLGQLDDLGVMMLGLRTFFEFTPPNIVAEHLKRLAQEMKWEVKDKPPEPPDNVVEGDYRVEE